MKRDETSSGASSLRSKPKCGMGDNLHLFSPQLPSTIEDQASSAFGSWRTVSPRAAPVQRYPLAVNMMRLLRS
jgi:hypothetical protein